MLSRNGAPFVNIYHNDTSATVDSAALPGSTELAFTYDAATQRLNTHAFDDPAVGSFASTLGARGELATTSSTRSGTTVARSSTRTNDALLAATSDGFAYRYDDRFANFKA